MTAMTRDPAAKEGKGITPGPLYMMKALQIDGALYVREEDCRASVNEALKITAADRDHLRERVKELEEALRALTRMHCHQSGLYNDRTGAMKQARAALSKSPK